jgi:hypothetical protein
MIMWPTFWISEINPFSLQCKRETYRQCIYVASYWGNKSSLPTLWNYMMDSESRSQEHRGISIWYSVLIFLHPGWGQGCLINCYGKSMRRSMGVMMLGISLSIGLSSADCFLLVLHSVCICNDQMPSLPWANQKLFIWQRNFLLLAEQEAHNRARL